MSKSITKIDPNRIDDTILWLRERIRNAEKSLRKAARCPNVTRNMLIVYHADMIIFLRAANVRDEWMGENDWIIPPEDRFFCDMVAPHDDVRYR